MIAYGTRNEVQVSFNYIMRIIFVPFFYDSSVEFFCNFQKLKINKLKYNNHEICCVYLLAAIKHINLLQFTLYSEKNNCFRV